MRDEGYKPRKIAHFLQELVLLLIGTAILVTVFMYLGYKLLPLLPQAVP